MRIDMQIHPFLTFEEMYAWLQDNASKEKELFVVVSRKKKEKSKDILSYVDAVNAALCFGWIDSTLRNIDGVLIQRFSPRRKHSHWTELNISRCKELDQQGLMTPVGKAVCPYFNQN